ncbi:MAG: DUF6285 domain-containing protein [Myxococcota bacterium]
MQDPPATDQLLDALAAFLGRDVLPAVTDPALQFRVRIAAHLCAGLGREAASGCRATGRTSPRWPRSSPPRPPPPTTPRSPGAIRDTERALADHVRRAPLDDAAYAALAGALQAIAGQKVAVANPKFDRSDDFDRIE